MNTAIEIHDRIHSLAEDSMQAWEVAYLRKEECEHCIGCKHLKTDRHLEDAYISIQCHHPAVLAQIRFGEIESVLDHDPREGCPMPERLKLFREEHQEDTRK